MKNSYGKFILLGLLFTARLAYPADDQKGIPELLNSFKFDSGIGSKEINILKTDLLYLSQLKITAQDPAFNKVFALQKADNKSILQWLVDRVHLLLGSEFDWKTSNRFVDPPAGNSFAYENPDIFPDSDDDIYQSALAGENEGLLRRTGRIRIIASNFGIEAYLKGKREQKPIGLDLPGIGFTVITSPRLGLIQTGPNMFKASTRLDASGNRDIDTKAHRILRVSYLFHEAKHSDGNGKSLGFLHTRCPKGHELAGNAVCDRNLNGPYSVGGHSLKYLSQFCITCAPSEKEGLRLLALENFTRVILRAKKILSDREKEICTEAAKKRTIDPSFPLPEYCLDVIHSQDWDSTPEAVR